VVGIGVATFIENTAAGWESGAVRVEADGSVTAISGAVAMGQGVETVLAQIVADTLRLPIDQITLRMGDTALTQQAQGSFGSRSTAIAGSALRQAAERVRERAAAIAADLLEASVDDVVIDGGMAYLHGAAARGVSWERIARAAYPPLGQTIQGEPGLEERAFFQAPAESIAAGAYLALVSVDPETGRLTLERLIAADDSGTVINPLLIAGQVQGAVAQGIGEAMFERLVYDASGQPLCVSFLDYAMPRCADVIWAETVHQVTPGPHNPLGAKGAGEAGVIGTPPAIVNAVVDALAPYGVRHIDPPLHPEKIWRLLQRKDC
jgi:carbon-monoxide dehydrogenase large subunit